TTNALSGNASYEVRLVAVSASSLLHGVSEVESFRTKTATAPPAVTIDAAGDIGTRGATFTGSVNPRGDTATVRLQISRDPHCNGGFEDEALQSIAPASEIPVGIVYQLADLLPAEHYCGRLLATNSAGDATSNVAAFETLAAPPTQVFTAFSA